MIEADSKTLVVEYFIENPTAAIIEISGATNISKSSVQRYLNHPDVVGLIIPKTGLMIKDQLLANKAAGNSKGGRVTFSKYDAVKDNDGRFVGVNPSESDNNEERKLEEVTRASLFFSRSPHLTVEELSDALGYENRSYVYDLLTDPRVLEIFGSVMATSISERLEKNIFTILKKLPEDFNAEMLEETDLTDRERDVISRRLNNGTPVSADQVSSDLGISRAMILKIENRAASKIAESRGKRNIR